MDFLSSIFDKVLEIRIRVRIVIIFRVRVRLRLALFSQQITKTGTLCSVKMTVGR